MYILPYISTFAFGILFPQKIILKNFKKNNYIYIYNKKLKK